MLIVYRFAAPEILGGNLVTRATDVYSIAAVIFETITQMRRKEFTKNSPPVSSDGKKWYISVCFLCKAKYVCLLFIRLEEREHLNTLLQRSWSEKAACRPTTDELLRALVACEPEQAQVAHSYV